MRLDDAAAVLDVWTAGSGVHPVLRGAAVVGPQGPTDGRSLTDVPLAALATAALALLARHSTAPLDTLARCPRCDEEIELALPWEALREDETPPQTLRVPTSAGPLVLRAPTTGDLLALVDADPVEARDAVLGRCARHPDGTAVDTSTLAEPDLVALADATERLTGLAVAEVATRCPTCDRPIALVVHPENLLWQAVETAAGRALREVATLAAAFGWSEADVLAVPPARRRAYLELVEQGAW